MNTKSSIEKNISAKKTLTEKTQTLLEYPQIMEKVSSYAVSEEAANIIKNLSPVYDDGSQEIKQIVIAICSMIK